MPKTFRRCVLTAGLIAGLFLPRPFQAETKTLKRIDDPVVMECRDFVPLFKSPMARLALMARHGKDWVPIPFQIDQKKPDGNYAFAMGAEASEDPDPTLDENDELVFMVKDTGDSFGGVAPEGAEAGVEIEVTDPKNGQKGWAYLFRFHGKAPRSGVDYVRLEIDPVKKRRRVTTHEYVMEGATDRVVPDLISKVQDDGTPGLDLLDRLKIRGEFILPLGIRLDYIFDEWAKCEEAAYIDGPIRVLAYAPGYLELSTFIRIHGEGYSVISYYDNHVIWPMYIEVPFDLGGIVKEWPTLGFMDFNSNVYGSHSFSAANPYSEDVVFDGRMNEAEKNLDTQTEIDWIAGIGPQGAMVSRLVSPPEWAVVKKLPYYMDDETALDPPEDDPGVIGVGYNLVGFEKLGKYSATFYQYYYFKRELEPENVDTILDIRDHPVEARVRAIGQLD